MESFHSTARGPADRREPPPREIYKVDNGTFIEGVQRLFASPEVGYGGLLILGIIGLAANVASVLVLSAGRGHNLNMRAAFLEVVNDALGSVAVIVSALIIATTGWTQADAIAGMAISVLIFPRAVKILRQAGSVLLETVPDGLDLVEVRTHLFGRAARQ